MKKDPTHQNVIPINLQSLFTVHSNKILYQHMLWEDTTMQRRTIYLHPEIKVIQQEVVVKILGNGTLLEYGQVHKYPTKSGSRKHSEFTHTFLIKFDQENIKWVHYKTINKQLHEMISNSQVNPFQLDYKTKEQSLNEMKDTKELKGLNKQRKMKRDKQRTLSVFKQSTEVYFIEVPKKDQNQSIQMKNVFDDDYSIECLVLRETFTRSMNCKRQIYSSIDFKLYGIHPTYCQLFKGKNILTVNEIRNWCILMSRNKISLFEELKCKLFLFGTVISIVFNLHLEKDSFEYHQEYYDWLSLFEMMYKSLYPLFTDEMEYYLTCISSNDISVTIYELMLKCSKNIVWNKKISYSFEVVNESPTQFSDQFGDIQYSGSNGK